MEESLNQKIKYYNYARKSSEEEDRQMLSIRAQQDEVGKTVRDLSLDVLESLEESRSAKVPGRPIFNKMLDDVEAGNVQGIVTWHANRLSRNPIDTGRIIYLMDVGKLVEVVTPTQVFRNLPNDKFMLNLYFSQAKLENDSRAVDVKKGLRAKAKLGWITYLAPAGYINVFNDKTRMFIVEKDPERFSLVRKIWDLILTGNYTPPQVLKIANDEWGVQNYQEEKNRRSAVIL